jgi:hypothetical protein
MSTRERHPDRLLSPGGGGGSGDDGSLDALRGAGDDLLAAADHAIDSALSCDSESFLQQSRQAGGE